jgi:glycine dehydrogenase subunit 2
MKLLFEKSVAGRKCAILPPCDVEDAPVPEGLRRKKPAELPNIDENELSRHYSALEKRAFGVNDGFYPLGSCTMKYNPKINEEAASLEGFTQIHPLQSEATTRGCREALNFVEQCLCEIAGMDAVTLQPAAGAHGELAGLLLIKAYHEKRGDGARKKIIVPDSAHGTNPASAVMAGFQVVNVASNAEGGVDLDALRAAAGPDTAGLMLTNPNTVGIFDRNILEITGIIRQAGGLNYYDGANLNAIMGVVRPGDMGFDVVHINLHKSFSTPHGGGGPGSGPVGCKKILAPFLPLSSSGFGTDAAEQGGSIGRVKAFYGNFLVVVKAAAYLLTLGKEGVREAAENAVLNANYMMRKLKDKYPVAYEHTCMHEFVLSLEKLKEEWGVSAMDIAKAMADRGMHPPTMYFPLIVHEALMLEPTETESKDTIDAVCETLLSLYSLAQRDPEALRRAPEHTVIGRPDEVTAARSPVLRWNK